MIKHVPNALTILRFILIPFIIVFLFQDKYVEALIFLILSGLTDVLDGFIARKFDCITNFGKLIDPLADKATQVGILITLVLRNIIPLWILVIVFVKELLMVAGASFLYGKETVVSSRWYGKLSTVIFYTAIGCSLVIKYWNSYAMSRIAAGDSFNYTILPQFDIYIYYLALVATLFSLVMYFIDFYAKGYFKKENLKIENK